MISWSCPTIEPSHLDCFYLLQIFSMAARMRMSAVNKSPILTNSESQCWSHPFREGSAAGQRVDLEATRLKLHHFWVEACSAQNRCQTSIKFELSNFNRDSIPKPFLIFLFPSAAPNSGPGNVGSRHTVQVCRCAMRTWRQRQATMTWNGSDLVNGWEWETSNTSNQRPTQIVKSLALQSKKLGNLIIHAFPHATNGHHLVQTIIARQTRIMKDLSPNTTCSKSRQLNPTKLYSKDLYASDGELFQHSDRALGNNKFVSFASNMSHGL